MGPAYEKDCTDNEEMVNSITHGIGLLLAVAGAVLLVVFSSIRGDAWTIVSCTIFGVGLVLLYANSTIYHALRSRTAKGVFQIMDHSAIFFLIAASYTPFTLTILRGPLGWTLFGLVWGGFVLGTIFKVFYTGRLKVLSVVLYLIMGWAVLLAIKPVIGTLPIDGLVLLAGGGIAYTLGAFIYAKKGIKYSHAVWHFYVLAGSIMHFFSIFLYVIPSE
ncbi:MAG: hemolysin III family protein [Candidatus Thermoplasmatota archaeon]|jgi:hemolysin III|nr:hemolysin III family protein [Candidatus Thermoplasmatota archaeon]